MSSSRSPVSHRNDHIKIVVFSEMSLHFPFNLHHVQTEQIQHQYESRVQIYPYGRFFLFFPGKDIATMKIYGYHDVLTSAERGRTRETLIDSNQRKSILFASLIYMGFLTPPLRGGALISVSLEPPH